MQLDLFTHSRDVMLQNDVLVALRARDATVGRKALSAFETEFPNHTNLAPLTILLDAPAASVGRCADHADAAQRVEFIETVVTPAATWSFGGNEAGHWIAPLWRALAVSAADLPFNIETAKSYSAFMLLQSGDWDAAEAKIARIPSWRRIPSPLAWMAQVRLNQGGLEHAWPLLIELAWIDADTFGGLARRLPSPPLHKLLREFDGAFEDGDAPGLAWFPAWVLVNAPAIAAVMRDTLTCNGNAPERAARLVSELLALEIQGRHADLVKGRKKLRGLHAELYGIYMASR